MSEKEAAARIKINRLLEISGWRFFRDGNSPANICLEPSVKIKSAEFDAIGDNFETERGFVDFVLVDAKSSPQDTTVLDFPSCFPDSVVGLIPSRGTDACYLDVVMRTKKQRLNEIALQAAQRSMNMEIPKNVDISLRPLATRQAGVAEIGAEKVLVNANREPMARLEK